MELALRASYKSYEKRVCTKFTTFMYILQFGN